MIPDPVGDRSPSSGPCTLFPVVLKVPESIRALAPPQRGKALGLLARKSVALSARRMGITIGELTKGAQGQPLPWSGVHWSLTHKPWHVAGVVSWCPVGIDIEEVKPVSFRLFRRICSEREAGLFHGVPRETVFFRCFTAKEAVLKRHGVGLSGLNDVAVVEVIDALHLGLSYKGAFARVEHFLLGGHMASIAGIKTNVAWTLGPLK